MAYGGFKSLKRKTDADKVLRDKAFNINKNQRGLDSMVYKRFDKKTSGSSIKNENISNKEWAGELRKPIIRKFTYLIWLLENLQSHFIENIWGADLGDMQLISKFNEDFRFLLCFIGIYSK